jgi:hypothetical protein
MPYSRVRTVLIDLKAVRPNNTRAERADFILKDLEIPGTEVLALYMLQVGQLFLVTVATDAVYEAAVTKLREGVKWTAAESLAGPYQTLYCRCDSPMSTLTSPWICAST